MIKPSIIIENGSANILAGYSNDDSPMVSFPTKDRDVTSNNNSNQINSLMYPIEYGIVKDHHWDSMTNVWQNTFFNELRVDPSEQSILMTQSPQNPPEKKLKTTQIMFETFLISQFYLANKMPLPLYSLGKQIGLVLDSGETITNCASIFEGYTLPYTISKTKLSGKYLTYYFSKLLNKININYPPTVFGNSVLNRIKQQICYVTLDPIVQIQKNKQQNNEHSYILPCGLTVNIKNQRWMCPQALFNSSLINQQFPTFQQTVINSLQKSDLDLQNKLINNIVLSGGNNSFRNIKQRLELQIHKSNEIPQHILKNIRISSELNKFSVWIGGAIVSSLPSFKSMWITKQQYQQFGQCIVRRKCF